MEVQIVKRINDSAQLVLSRPAIAKSSYSDNAGSTIIVTGPKVAGSSPPERAPSTQALVDYYLNLGIPANNILWNVVGESGAGGDFVIGEMFVSSTMENITIINPGENLIPQDMFVSSQMEVITLFGEFVIAEMHGASVMETLTLTQDGGSFVIAEMTGASLMEQITLASEYLFIDEFTGSNGSAPDSSRWNTIQTAGGLAGGSTCDIQGNTLKAHVAYNNGGAGFSLYIIHGKDSVAYAVNRSFEIVINRAFAVSDICHLLIGDATADFANNYLQLQIGNNTDAHLRVQSYSPSNVPSEPYNGSTVTSNPTTIKIVLKSASSFEIFLNGSSQGTYNASVNFTSNLVFRLDLGNYSTTFADIAFDSITIQ